MSIKHKTRNQHIDLLKSIKNEIKKYSFARLIFKDVLYRILHLTIAVNYFIVHYIKLYLLKNKHRKIIVINLIENLGDIVACEPVSRSIRERDPDAFIIWTVRKQYLELIANNPYIDLPLVVSCLTEWILLSKTKIFNEVIDLHSQGRICSICRIPLKKKKYDHTITLENYFLHGNLLEAFTKNAMIKISNDQPRVYLSKQNINKVDNLNLPENYIVIHCSSKEKVKDWQEYKWSELVDRIISTYKINIVEVGVDQIIKTNKKEYLSLCKKVSILETAVVIKRALLFIGIDSGPAHLANAVHTDGVILLGIFRAYNRYMPYSGGYGTGRSAKIVYSNGFVSEIDVDTVFKAVSEMLYRKNTSTTIGLTHY